MIRVLDPGPLTTVQDLGRAGQLRFGIPPSGPMDRESFILANRLVGNPEGAAGLECTVAGPRLSIEAPCTLAVTGADAPVTVNGTPVRSWATLRLGVGDVVKIGAATSGARLSIAVAGGIDVPEVLGSRSTYVRGRLGGYAGRALRKDDLLRIHGVPAPPERWPERWIHPDALPEVETEPTLRVVLGPQADRFTDEGIATLLTSAYEMLPQSDRMGARLSGPRITHTSGHDIVSDGIALGSIQVPGDGQPIVLLVDRQSTGGYTKIATMCSFDVRRLSQVRPGRRVRFQAVTVEQAHELLRAHRAALDQILIHVRHHDSEGDP